MDKKEKEDQGEEQSGSSEEEFYSVEEVSIGSRQGSFEDLQNVEFGPDESLVTNEEKDTNLQNSKSKHIKDVNNGADSNQKGVNVVELRKLSVENVGIDVESTKHVNDESKEQQVKTETVLTNSSDVEFVVKNLDTGQSFSSKDIEKFIPKALDPIFAHILDRSPSEEQQEQPEYKRKNSWIKKVAKKSKDLKSSLEAAKTKKTKKMYAQITKQQLQHNKVTKSPVWVMKFNYDGMQLATGGKDGVVNIWKIGEPDNLSQFFQPEPYRTFGGKDGHIADILCLSWSESRSNLLLSASMDRTVRLWDVNKNECKHIFQLEDVVTAVQFHPKNEELFITGSLDNKLKVWNVVEKKIVCVTVVNCGFITSAAFDTDGSGIIVGSYNGSLTFFDTKDLKYRAQKYLQQSKKGKKITGIHVVPGTKQALITSNDSSVRLYNLHDYTVLRKYKGLTNNNFQIYATSSEKGTFIICGSEDQHVYMWETNDIQQNVLLGVVKTRVMDSFQAHSNAVTVALFAPLNRRKTKLEEGQIIVTTDTSGELKVFENKRITTSST